MIPSCFNHSEHRGIVGKPSARKYSTVSERSLLQLASECGSPFQVSVDDESRTQA